MKLEMGRDFADLLAASWRPLVPLEHQPSLPDAAFFSSLFGTRVGLWQLDLCTGLLSCDAVASAMLGFHPYTPTPFELLPLSKDDRAKLGRIFDSAADNAVPFDFEFLCSRPEGSHRWLHILGRELDDCRDANRQAAGLVTDVSERKSVDIALRESEATNRSIVSASTDCIKLLDLDGRLLFMNDYGARAMEVEDVTALYGRTLQSFWPRSARSAIRRAIANARQGGGGRFSGACSTFCGQMRWWDVIVSPVCDETGLPIKLVAISRDMSERHAVEERLLQAATCDALTGLPNRNLFHSRLANAIQKASEYCGHVGLLLIDLDDFKQVNDTLGHDAGDALLTILAARLSEFRSEQVVVARLGGDEFAIIVAELADEAALQATADTILNRLREPFIHANRLLDCHATIGASMYPNHGHSPAEMLKCADMALYVAKNSSRGSNLVFRPSYRAEVRKRGAMIDRARRAVNDHGIVPYYQPIVSLPSREIIGFEALLRLRRPKGKSALSPAAIMAAFDDPELAAAISERIIGQVISDMRLWLDQGVPFNRIAINASAADFRREKFADSIIERLRSADIPARHLQLEVTETVLLGRRGDQVEQSLSLLSSEGIRIILDDFGTGYASLSHLKQFPVYGVKIDKSFIQEMHHQPENIAIIEAILNLGARLGLDVVAEGIETEEQARDLILLDCHFAQGFLFSRAIPAEGVKALLSEGRKLYQPDVRMAS